MKKFKAVLVLAALALAPMAQAVVTVTVDDKASNDAAYVDGVGGNFTGATALKDAVNAVNADASAETVFNVNIVDTDGVADIYTGDVKVNKAGVTIQQMPNGNNNDVAVEIVGDKTINVNLSTIMLEATQCAVKGLSATKQLVVHAGGASPAIGTGSNAVNATDQLWQYITYKDDGGAALDHNDDFTGAGMPGTQVFDHCTFKVGNGPQTFVGTTYNDCRFDGPGIKLVQLGGDIIVNRGIITPGAGGLHHGGNTGKHATFNDCQFNSNARLLGWAPGVTLDTVFNFNRPVFTGSCGDIIFNIDAEPATVNVTGTPTNKVDLDPANAALFCRLTNGQINYTDCKATKRLPAGANDSANGQPLAGDVKVTMTRCEWGNGSGEYITGDATASAFKVDFSATNTIWYGTSPAGHIIALVGPHTGGGEMSFTHCTVVEKTANAFFFGTPETHLFLEGSIIYSNSITSSHAISSIGYEVRTPHIPCITYVYDPDASDTNNGTGGVFQGNPFSADPWKPAHEGDLVVWPGIDMANGKGVIPANSSACGAATGSTITDDVNGNVRPLPAGTAPDIGAVEVLNVPVELSTFAAE